MKIALTTIDSEETREIINIYKLMNNLKLLSSIIPKSDSILLARNVSDMEECERNFNNWWLKISQKYELNTVPDGKWIIDFKTNIIYLIKS